MSLSPAPFQWLQSLPTQVAVWFNQLVSQVNGALTNIATLQSSMAALSPINLTNALSDQTLNLGQKAYYEPTSGTSQQLHIATSSPQIYEITITGPIGSNSSGSTYAVLEPNNSTGSNWFLYTTIFTTGGANTYTQGFSQQGALLEPGKVNPNFCKITASVLTTNKNIFANYYEWINAVEIDLGMINSLWTTNGTTVSPDTTTPWTSLGTLSFPYSIAGMVIEVERKL